MSAYTSQVFKSLAEKRTNQMWLEASFFVAKRALTKTEFYIPSALVFSEDVAPMIYKSISPVIKALDDKD